jgi:hypothetical protein
MWALVRVKPTASGFTDQVFLILARLTPLSSLPALFQGFWILTVKSTLGSWGYPPDVDFWDLLAKISPPCLRLPYFKAFGLSLSNLPWAHGAIPQMETFGTCGQTFPPLSSLALFQGFWILTLISTLGSWGYPLVLDFWDLWAKIYPLIFACLISRLLDSHTHIYLGLMGLSPSCRLLGLVGKNVCVFVFFPTSFTPIAPPCAGLYSEPLFLESLSHQT